MAPGLRQLPGECTCGRIDRLAEAEADRGWLGKEPEEGETPNLYPLGPGRF